jgi:hypothetical protein
MSKGDDLRAQLRRDFLEVLELSARAFVAQGTFPSVAACRAARAGFVQDVLRGLAKEPTPEDRAGDLELLAYYEQVKAELRAKLRELGAPDD